MTISAIYEDGVFKPLEDVAIQEGTVVQVWVPSNKERLEEKRRSVREFAFTGMWQNREEMKDSVDYVNRLRRDIR